MTSPCLCCSIWLWCSVRCFFFSSRRRHTRLQGDWSSDVCSSDLFVPQAFFCLNELSLQLIQIGAADIAQLHSLEVIPNPLIRVEIRGVAGKLFQMQDRKSVV